MADITKREENQSNFGQQAGNLVPSHQNTAAYLDHTQQDLLLAALNSQLPHAQSATGQDYKTHNMTSADTFTPDLLDLDDSFDFEDADLGGSMIGALPGSETFAEQHEKRKASDDEDVEGGDLKRQEMGGEKGATKKPGRKPLTSEPTTVSTSCFYECYPNRRRNEKHRIVLPNVPSVSARKHISKILKPRSPN